jgi:hypothetical protein
VRLRRSLAPVHERPIKGITMPSETTKQVGEHFTSYSTYSWSECGNYDDQTGYATCNACGVMVMDEYSALEEHELEAHETGLCVLGRQVRLSAYISSKLVERLYKACTWCNRTPCDCPF